MSYRSRFPREHPPWWPADEAWPPAGPQRRQGWRRMRGRFFRRMGCLLGLLFVLGFGGLTLLVWLAASVLGLINVPPGVLVFACPIGILLLTFGFASIVVVGRALRSATRPIGDVMEAAGHVAEGDYSAHVAEREKGPAGL